MSPPSSPSSQPQRPSRPRTTSTKSHTGNKKGNNNNNNNPPSLLSRALYPSALILVLAILTSITGITSGATTNIRPGDGAGDGDGNQQHVTTGGMLGWKRFLSRFGVSGAASSSSSSSASPASPATRPSLERGMSTSTSMSTSTVRAQRGNPSRTPVYFLSHGGVSKAYRTYCT